MNSPDSSNAETQLIPTRFIRSFRASTRMIYMYTNLTFAYLGFILRRRHQLRLGYSKYETEVIFCSKLRR
jgi:hypothetical protein